QAWVARKSILKIVVANKSQRVPGFDLCKQSRRRLGMLRDVVVKPGCKSITQCAHLWIEPTVFFARQTRNLKRAVAAILFQLCLAVKFRRAAQSQNEILFKAPEIILGLSVGKAENRARIGGAKNVRHAVAIAVNSHRCREFFRVNRS